MTKRKHSLRLLQSAEDDIEEIIDYISDDSISASHKMLDGFGNLFELLIDNPYLGKIPNEQELIQIGYRYLIHKNYLIFYKIEYYEIVIFRIIHGARDYKEILTK